MATETLRAPPFARTVVYVVRHDAAGAMGLVVNRPVRDMPLAPLLRKFGRDDRGVTGTVRAHYGGPVEIGQGFLLHTAEYATEGTERVAGDIAMTPTPGVLTALGDIARGAGPRKSLFAIGYAGWAPASSRARSSAAPGSRCPPTKPSSSTRTPPASGTAPPPAAASPSSGGQVLHSRHCRNVRPDPHVSDFAPV